MQVFWREKEEDRDNHDFAFKAVLSLGGVI